LFVIIVPELEILKANGKKEKEKLKLKCIED